MLLPTLAAFGSALAMSAAGFALLSSDRRVPDAARAPRPRPAPPAPPLATPRRIIPPVVDAPEPYFNDFRPDLDRLVVVCPDGATMPGPEDLRLSYDADYDETEVRLVSGDADRLVCYLPGVRPEAIDLASVEFIPAGAAAALLADA
ncbi:hypothetical protein SAMN05444413_11037 [Roseivivax marinus]|uniref:hypothetical protein n=1 Tax=Roseivivax marinus TaxID=1379903 RepID=UPI0008C276B5|nr:hypothetical protein [Roseivivax marinus]SEL52137.1 hypothetical protein SAMN05444413_11037 [Roseivivax marinus]